MLLDIDKNPHLKDKEIRQIFFYFDRSIFGLEILIGDRELYTDREIKQNKFFFSGEQLYMRKSYTATSSQNHFIAELSQHRFVEADSSANCVNYPTDHKTYNDCDKNYIKKVLSTYSPNFSPIWSTLKMEQVSELLSTPGIFPNHSVTYEDLSDGTQISDCPLPCTQTYVETRSISYITNEDNSMDAITVTFVDNVEVTVYDFPRFQMVSFISQVTNC